MRVLRKYIFLNKNIYSTTSPTAKAHDNHTRPGRPSHPNLQHLGSEIGTSQASESIQLDPTTLKKVE